MNELGRGAMAVPPVRVLEICAGFAGLSLAVELACPRARTVGFVERESFAASLIVARMGDATLGPAPVGGDLFEFDGRPWAGAVDFIVAGFPCQPASAAGKRTGIDDERWMFPEIARIVREIRPRFLFLENVPGLATVNAGGAFSEVLGTLAGLGFDAEWGVFSSAGCGAPHRRRRIFILAWNLADDSDSGREHGGAGPVCRRRDERGDNDDRRDPELAVDPGRGRRVRGISSGGHRFADGGDEELADSGGAGFQGVRYAEPGGAPVAGRARGGMADAEGDDRGARGGRQETGARPNGIGGLGSPGRGPGLAGIPYWPPGRGPGDLPRWAAVLNGAPFLVPSVPVADSGEPEIEAAESAFRGVAHGAPDWMERSRTYRADKIRCLGNAVSPIVGSFALSVLADRSGIDDVRSLLI